jgi:hypothetical protein
MRITLLTLLFVSPLVAASAAAQTAPPIHGVTGTVATDSTIRSEHEAAHKIAEGAARVVGAILPGGKGTNQNPLDALIEGSQVLVRDVVDDVDAANTATEGVVIDVNRSRRQITIRSADKTIQTLRVMDGTAAAAAGAHVVVSLSDQPSAAVYDFKRVS